MESPSEYSHNVWYEKTRIVCLPDGRKFYDMFNLFDRIPACNRQTDGHLHTRRAVKQYKRKRGSEMITV